MMVVLKIIFLHKKLNNLFTIVIYNSKNNKELMRTMIPCGVQSLEIAREQSDAPTLIFIFMFLLITFIWSLFEKI
tara:strand:+ start:804 stop:1028 length:225 start_codon:yes stop_codon:yes gene_type:complete